MPQKCGKGKVFNSLMLYSVQSMSHKALWCTLLDVLLLSFLQTWTDEADQMSILCAQAGPCVFWLIHYRANLSTQRDRPSIAQCFPLVNMYIRGEIYIPSSDKGETYT